MENLPSQTTENNTQCIVPIVVSTPIINGVIGGISSVIASYLFKPVWDRIVKLYTTNIEVK
jgi:hypothetical protein